METFEWLLCDRSLYGHWALTPLPSLEAQEASTSELGGS